MNVTTIGRKINLRQSFTERVQARMDKFDKYFDDPEATVTVTATFDNAIHTVEILLRSRGLMYRAERKSDTLDVAFDDAADVLLKQIVKFKNKLGARIKKGAADIEFSEPPVDSGDLVREKRFAVSRMSVDDAILQMDMLNHNFFLFKDEKNGDIHVVYRRDDGNYGLLIPLE